MKFVRCEVLPVEKLCAIARSSSSEQVINISLLLMTFESGINAKTNADVSASLTLERVLRDKNKFPVSPL
jgi:hypothetical protein